MPRSEPRHTAFTRPWALVGSAAALVVAVLASALPAFASPVSTGISGIPAGWSASDVTFSIFKTEPDGSGMPMYYKLDTLNWTTYMDPVTITHEGTTRILYWSVEDPADLAGWLPNTAEILIDKSAPVTTIGGLPADIVPKGGSFGFTLHGADPYSGVDKSYYRVNSGATVQYPGGTVSLTATDTTTISYWSVDKLGHVEAANTATVLVDNGFPVTSVAGIPVGWTSAADVAFTLTPHSSSHTVTGTYYRIGAGSWTPYVSAVHVSAEGTTAVSYYSVDDAAQTESARTAYIRIDRTAPVSSAGGMPGGWAGAPVTFTLSATDAHSGVAAIHYQLNSGTDTVYGGPVIVPVAGTTHVTWWAVDRAGNAETSHNTDINIDGGPITDWAAEEHYWHAASVTMALTVTTPHFPVTATYYTINSGPQLTYTTPFLVDGEGDNTVTFHSVNDQGTAGATVYESILIDKSNPVSHVTGAPTGWSSRNATLSISASDAYSGVGSLSYRIGDGVAQPYATPLVISAEGTTTLSSWAIDVAGNAELPHTTTIAIDKTAPVSAAAGLPSVSTSGPVALTLSGTDARSGIAGLRFRVDGAAAATYTVPVAITAAGSHTVQWWAVDRAGNTEVAHSATFTIAGSGAASPTTLTIKTSKTSAARGTQFILSGLVTPSPAMVGRLMHVDVMKPGKAYWTYSSNRVIYAGTGGVASWQYKYTLVRTMAKGVYTFRAVYDGAADALTSKSGTVKVTVR